jgi:hypothetical protein
VQVYNSATLVHGEWAFPEELGYGARIKDVDCVYNVVLSPGATPYLETTQNHRIITLAHGLDHSPVVRHSFFGGQLLREKCKAAPGWQEGRILKVDKWTRNSESELIDDIHFSVENGFATAAGQLSRGSCSTDVVILGTGLSQTMLKA